MKHTLKYIINSLMVLCVCLGYAQEEKKDSLAYPQRYGLRVGLDLNKFQKNQVFKL